MNKAVFWDFDGTLAHSGTRWSGMMQVIMKENGYDVPHEYIRLHFSKGFPWHNPEIDYCGLSADGWWERLFVCFNALYQSCGITDESASVMNEGMRKKIIDPRSYTLYDDSLYALSESIARGYDNYILSNNFPELPDVARGLGLYGCIKECVVSAAVGYEKPRIELFDHARRIANMPEICYMVGDNPITDVMGAKDAGMIAVLVHSEEENDADYVFRELAEIPAILT